VCEFPVAFIKFLTIVFHVVYTMIQVENTLTSNCIHVLIVGNVLILTVT